MKEAQLRYVFDRSKTASNTKTGLLQIEVRKIGTNERILISTGIRLLKNQFSTNNGFTCKNHPNALGITGKASQLFRQIEAFVLSDACRTIKDSKNWDKDESQIYSVVDFMKKELSKSNPTHATWEHNSALIRQIESFGKIKVFSDITYQNISDFDAYLRSHGVKAGSTLNKRHSTFRMYIKKAIYMDLCKKDPYNEFKMPSKKGKDPVYLIDSEIQSIINYIPIIDKLKHVKDLFVFQIFTGLSFIDLMNFSREYISELDGMKVIKSNRAKTDESFISLFLPEAEVVADKYNYELPKLSNQKYNDYLKLLGAGSGLNKSLTSHVARHIIFPFTLKTSKLQNDFLQQVTT